MSSISFPPHPGSGQSPFQNTVSLSHDCNSGEPQMQGPARGLQGGQRRTGWLTGALLPQKTSSWLTQPTNIPGEHDNNVTTSSNLSREPKQLGF